MLFLGAFIVEHKRGRDIRVVLLQRGMDVAGLSGGSCNDHRADVVAIVSHGDARMQKVIHDVFRQRIDEIRMFTDFVEIGELREKLVHANMQEITTGEMTDLIGEIEELKRQADELNRKNALLTGRYGGDEKYMRIHKEMMSDAKPVTSSERQLFEILSAAKRAIDAMVSSNAAALDQPSVFKRALGPKVIQAFRNDDITLTGQQVSTTVTRLYNEYSDERKNHLR